jgi:hypothetical protein
VALYRSKLGLVFFLRFWSAMDKAARWCGAHISLEVLSAHFCSLGGVAMAAAVAPL